MVEQDNLGHVDTPGTMGVSGQESEHMREMYGLLRYAIKTFPWDLQIGLTNVTTFDYGRKNDKRPAYIKQFVPDDWVKNMTGDTGKTNLYLTIMIPRDIVNRYEDREEARDPIVVITDPDGSVVTKDDPYASTDTVAEQNT